MNTDQKRIAIIVKLLQYSYPNAHMMLTYKTPWELLVAVMLSAQCTDVMVNKVTPILFSLYPTMKNIATADPTKLEQTIKSTGFYRNKAKHMIGAAKLLIQRFHGEIPHTMEELVTIPGVARKTANVVLVNAFHKNEGVAVDTHVLRLSQRLHLVPPTAYGNPIKTEQELMKQIPKSEWGNITYRLIDHGRAVCTGQKPKCDLCILANVCPSVFLFQREKRGSM